MAAVEAAEAVAVVGAVAVSRVSSFSSARPCPSPSDSLTVLFQAVAASVVVLVVGPAAVPGTVLDFI